MKKDPKKKNRRSQIPYPALDPTVNLKSRYDQIDQDYLDKLSPKELDWLNRFMAEFVGADFKHKGAKFHKSKKDRKLCTDMNNARNRCIYTREKACGALMYTEEIVASEAGTGKKKRPKED